MSQPYRIIDLEQGSPEWVQYRKTRIGGSDAAAIMGASPWSTPYQKYCEKMDISPPKEVTRAMRRGTELEPVARQLLSENIGVPLNPAVVESIAFPYLLASLDAISSDAWLVGEIKCPGEEDHRLAMNGVVPEHYTWQLYHTFNIMPHLTHICYYSYHSLGNALVLFYPDAVKQQRLLEGCAAFMKCMDTFTPPELTDRDYKSREDLTWTELVGEFADAQRMVNEWTKELEKRRERLIEASGSSNTIGGGIRLTKVIRRGLVDYLAIPELIGVDLDSYRKKPSESWRITTL